MGNKMFRWTSFKDKLPSLDTRILITTESRTFIGYIFTFHNNSEKYVKCEEIESTSHLLNKSKFTHWAPLPELPKSEKLCSRCKKLVPVKEFHKNKLSVDGLAGWCKQCSREKGKEYDKARRGLEAEDADVQ